MILPFVSAVPDAPASVWLTGVENPPFDKDGIITVNWEPVANENISRYNIYPIDTASGQVIYVGSNTTATTYIFSGHTSGNFTFNVAAVNNLDQEGPATISDWVFIKTVPPTISFVAPTPENNAYTKNNWTTISISVTDSFLDSVILNWNGADMFFKDPPGIIRAYPPEMHSEGKYSYYLWANDSAGNSIKSETRYITYDATKPSITVNSPADGAKYYSLTIPIEYTATDNSPVSCFYEYDSINTTLTDCKRADLTPIYGNGSNITIWVSDAAGNINFEYVLFSSNPPKPPVILSATPERGKTIEAPSISGKNTETISVKVDKASQCKYATAPNTSFEAMQYGFVDTGSNIHNATISLTDKASYSFYVRCASTDTAVDLEDYLLQFSTADPSGLLIIDPEGTVLKNNTLLIETMAGRTTSVNVPVKTRAAYDVTNVVSTSSGNGSSFVIVVFPPAIKSNGISNITVQATPSASGTFNAEINLSFGGFSSAIPVEIIVFDDIFSELNMIEATISNSSASIDVLKSKGRDVGTLSDELNRIAPELSLVRSLYDEGKYAEASKRFMPLSESYNSLKEDILSAEGGGRIGNESFDATGSNSSIGGMSLTTTIIIIIVVIVIVVLVTSLVHKDKKKEAAADAPPQETQPEPSENPANYGI